MSTVGNQVGTMGQKEENKEVDANKLPTPPSTAKKYILFCLPLLLLAWLFSEEYYFAYEQQNLLTLLIKPLIFILIYGLSFRLFFSWIYERVRAKFSDSAHFLNYAIIYIPLCLFLLSAASALYKGSSEVFAISPAVEREAMLKTINTELLTYKSKCSTTAAVEHAACVEQYLTDSVLARLVLLEDRAQGFANSYSVIAIMTGFFGVLMTVLIIYFSISGKEAIQQKLKIFEDDFTRLRGDFKKQLENEVTGFNEKLSDSKTATQTLINENVAEFKSSLESTHKSIMESTNNGIDTAIANIAESLRSEIQTNTTNLLSKLDEIKNGNIDDQQDKLMPPQTLLDSGVDQNLNDGNSALLKKDYIPIVSDGSGQNLENPSDGNASSKMTGNGNSEQDKD